MDKELTDKDKQALDYHSKGRKGKIEVVSTKPCLTSRDLSLAYTPGVAVPCLEINKDPSTAYQYTSKGNLVGVISNGTAVLGLGNIGAMASKPVMEGKGVLFKRFADIDVFDIEVNETSVEGMVNVVKALEPTFGGINLEDIKAPECFEIEKQLIEIMDIPVFHDDQHGTAIIASAGFINALEIQGKKASDVKVVFSGAGAAAMACANLFFELGVKRENLLMCDSKGVIYKGRQEGMNTYKEIYAVDTDSRTLADAMNGADAFIGCSSAGVLSQDMVKTMAPKGIIFAMANPTPEIFPDEVKEVRDDIVMATGRTDFPNQVNNVLGFPFIFRGALDVRAKKINLEMKLAAVKALAELAREDVPEDVRMAYGNNNFSFGPNYIIPKPFDRRVLTRVSPAVAKAAMESGVAQSPIEDIKEYAYNLEQRFGGSITFMKAVKDGLHHMVKSSQQRLKVVFSAGLNTRILNAAKSLREEEIIEPILLGDKDKIHKKIEDLGINGLEDIEIINPENHEKSEEFIQEYFEKKQRRGVTKYLASEQMGHENYFGSMMVQHGLADTLICGPTHTYPEAMSPLLNVIGTKNKHKASGIFILLFKNKTLFFTDCTVNIRPKAEELSQIAIDARELYVNLMKREPNVAFLSFSNFGSTIDDETNKIKSAVELTKKQCPNMKIDGEVQADVAVNKSLMEKLFPFSDLEDSADILVFPDLNSANISYKLLSELAECDPIGPVLVPMNKPSNIVQRTGSVNQIVNMSYLTALLSKWSPQ
ncbi:MAG: NADP-dependent malic enzyme [Bacteriovoracaceae bacterium]